MKFLAAILATAITLSGCFDSKDPAKKARGEKEKVKEKPESDKSGDVTFQSFIGRLKIAVQRRDTATLESMMSPDFGYRWDAGPPGETPFDYWQKNNLWNELASILGDRWVPHEGFMVVPPTLATNPDFNGYRAGVRVTNGSWRFAYFVPSPPAEAAPASASGPELPPVPAVGTGSQ